MSIIANQSPITIRRMEHTPADLQQYLDWMRDPEVMRFWDGMTVQHTYATVAEKYQARVNDGVTPCFILLDGQPIGYCQFYPTDADAYDCPRSQYAQHIAPTAKAFGMDLFLAPAWRDQGMGSRVISLLCDALFRDHGADVLLIDPKAHNAPAIACYKKCGFSELFTVPKREEQDGILHDSLIMARHKD